MTESYPSRSSGAIASRRGVRLMPRVWAIAVMSRLSPGRASPLRS